jgi:hypothetical protein
VHALRVRGTRDGEREPEGARQGEETRHAARH